MNLKSHLTQWLVFTLVLTWPGEIVAQQKPVEIDTLDRSYESELPRIPPREPSEAMQTFSLDERFRIELVASEPMVTDPVAMAFDEFGRLFVVEMRGYSEDEKDNLGVIRLLEDTDDDGVFDKSGIFLDGLSWPTAIACYKGGVFVGVAPNIIYCPDENHDGIADKSDVIFSGFSRRNVQGILNSFLWGFDNHLYGNGSSNGGDIRSTKHPDIPLVKLRRNDFRINVETNRLESLTGGGQHGMTFDRWGDRFVCSNSDHIQSIRFEQKYLERNRSLGSVRSRVSIAQDGASAPVYRASDVEPWRIVRTRLRVKGLVGGPVEGGGRPAGYFTSATGITVYQGDAFPSEFINQTYAFMGDVGSNLVHCKLVKDEGLEKTAHRIHEKSEFLTSTDNWFRPVQFANGPDGALYVIDMYRETIEHPLSLPPIIKQHLDLTSGRKRGRIYRIVGKKFRQPNRLMPGHANVKQLVEMLGHKNGWHRKTAARLLVEKRDESSISELKRIFNGSDNPIAKIHSLYILNSLNRLNGQEIATALGEKSGFVRQHAIRLAQSNVDKKQEWLSQLLSLSQDPDPRVRKQLAIALGDLDWGERKETWLKMATSQPMHSEIRVALLSSVSGFQADLFSELVKRQENVEPSLFYELVDQISRRKKIPELVSTIRLASDCEAELRDELLSKVFGSIGKRSEALVEELQQAGLQNANDIVLGLIKRSMSAALDNTVDPQSRIAAISRLHVASLNEIENVAEHLLSAAQPESIQSAAVQLIRRHPTEKILETVVERLPSLSPNAKRSSFSMILSRKDAISFLLDKLQAEELSPTLLFAADRQQLVNHSDSTIKQRAVSIFGVQEPRGEVVKQNLRVLKMHGEIAQGRNLFKAKCSVCHKLGNNGNHVGPDLQPLRNRGAEFFLTNILDPNREVDPRYESYATTTLEGQSFSGIIRSDTAAEITLVQADAKEKRIARDEIDELVATGKSLMPEGFEKELNHQQLADLIAFLVSEQ